jgi:hypothetical protein
MTTLVGKVRISTPFAGFPSVEKGFVDAGACSINK